MAVTAITPTALAANSPSASITDAQGVAATSTTDGWVVTPPVGATTQRLLFKFTAVTNGDTVVFQAGVNPPAKRAGLGNLSQPVLTAGQVMYIVIEGGRFEQADGTIKVVPGQLTTLCTVFALPAGGGGGY